MLSLVPCMSPLIHGPCGVIVRGGVFRNPTVTQPHMPCERLALITTAACWSIQQCQRVAHDRVPALGPVPLTIKGSSVADRLSGVYWGSCCALTLANEPLVLGLKNGRCLQRPVRDCCSSSRGCLYEHSVCSHCTLSEQPGRHVHAPTKKTPYWP